MEPRQKDAGPPDAGGRTRGFDVEPVIGEARAMVRAGDPESALMLLEAAMEHDPEHLELQGLADLVRGQLLKRYRELLGDGSGIPRPILEDEQVMRFNIPPDAGFLLAQMDGATSLGEILSVCGLDEFRAFRLLGRLVEAGIVEIKK
jgi:hypothetical protein